MTKRQTSRAAQRRQAFSDRERMTLRVSKLRRKYPYFATPLYNMGATSTSQIPSAGVDAQGNLYFNPRIFDDWETDELFSVLIHEVWHVLLRHHTRGIRFFGSQEKLTDQHKVWNIACDMEIHGGQMLDRYEFPLPGDYVCPRKYGFPTNQTAEWYAKKLLEEEECKEEEEGGEEGSGEGESGEDSSDSGNSDNSDNSDDSGDSSGSSDSWGGSSMDGVQRSWEEIAQDGEGYTQEERNEICRQKVIEDMKKFSSQQQGTLPGSFERWLDDALSPPEIPWETKLRNLVRNAFITATGVTHETYSRSSPIVPILARGFGKAPALPGMGAPEVQAVIVLDTSGSMGGGLLQSALSEIDGILRSCGGHRATVLSVDSKVQKHQSISSAQEVIVTGGGGTDMRIGIEAALECRPRPNIVIVLTDGYTPWPREKKGKYELVVGLIGSGSYAKDSVPSWAHTVEIS